MTLPDSEKTCTASEGADLLPVTIITGFLGSGKTTLLNHILRNQQGVRTAVLVNEFGEIGIDNDLILSTTGDMVELSNGCICCSINEDLVRAVAKLLERREDFDYLVVETTGLADPMPVAMTFVGRDLSKLTRLDSIITLVDAENYSLDQFESPAAYNQIRYGDIVLLNKTDLVSPSRLEELEGRIRQIKDGSRIFRTEHAKVPLSLILDVGLISRSQSRVEEGGHQHHQQELDGFSSVSFRNKLAFNAARLQSFLDQELPVSAFRAKGFLWIAGDDRRHTFHLTGRRFSMESDEWGSVVPENKLVIIGQHLDSEYLISRLEYCLEDLPPET